MSDLVYQTVMKESLGPVKVDIKAEIRELKTKYANQIIDSFNQYVSEIDGGLDSKNLDASIKLRSKKILIHDWIQNNLYGVEFENFAKLFNGHLYTPDITKISEKEAFDEVDEVIPMLNDSYALETSDGIPLPEKKMKVLYDDLRAPILSSISNKHRFVFAQYAGNGTKVYFKEDLGNTLESAIGNIVNPDTTNGLVDVYGLMSQLHKIDVLNVSIDNNGAVRSGKRASDASPYVSL